MLSDTLTHAKKIEKRAIDKTLTINNEIDLVIVLWGCDNNTITVKSGNLESREKTHYPPAPDKFPVDFSLTSYINMYIYVIKSWRVCVNVCVLYKSFS